MAAERPLTQRQKVWAQYYITHWNATKAAIEAGYLKGGASTRGYENAHNRRVCDYVSKLMVSTNDVLEKELEVDAAYVRRRLIEIDRLDAADLLDSETGELLAIREWPKSWRTLISGFEVENINTPKGIKSIIKRLKFPDKLKNMALLGKHVDVRAWEKEVEIRTETNNIMLVPSADSVDDWERAAGKVQKKLLEDN